MKHDVLFALWPINIHSHTREPLIGMSSLCVTRKKILKTESGRGDWNTHKIYVIKNATWVILLLGYCNWFLIEKDERYESKIKQQRCLYYEYWVWYRE